MAIMEYKGLRFCKYEIGNLPEREMSEVRHALALNKEPPQYWAWYGGVPMTEREIMQRIDEWDRNGFLDRIGMYFGSDPGTTASL